MDTEKRLTQTIRTKRNLKKAAKISLVVFLLSVVAQFVSIYQTSYQLVSPLIPQSLIWEISKQYIFKAFILTISCIIGLLFYFYDKYLWLIILVVLTLIASRFVYLPTSWLLLPPTLGFVQVGQTEKQWAFVILFGLGSGLTSIAKHL